MDSNEIDREMEIRWEQRQPGDIQTVLFAGKKFFLAVQPDGSINVYCPCRVLNAHVRLSLTPEQVHELFFLGKTERRHIRDILPDLPPPVQEIFIAGITPAEWDVTMSGRKSRSKKHYRSLGYVYWDEMDDDAPL